MGSALDEAIKALNKKLGGDFIAKGLKVTEYKRHSLGIDALDIAIGGGLPQRKIMMVCGEFSAGKSTTAITAVASIQKDGGQVAWLDTEGAFDCTWAQKFGVDVTKLIICRPQTVEDATDVLETLISSGELDLIVLDSIAVMPSAKELEESAEQKSMGGIAKSLGLCMRKVIARLNDPRQNIKTSIILINQLRDNVSGYGPKKYSPGGRQVHYQSDIIIWLKADSEPVGGKEAAQGITVNYKVIKNRTAPPLRFGTYNLMFTGYIDNKRAIVELAIIHGLIKKAGAIYTYIENGETKKAKGINSLVSGLTEELTASFKEQILEEVAKGNFETKPLSAEEELAVIE